MWVQSLVQQRQQQAHVNGYLLGYDDWLKRHPHAKASLQPTPMVFLLVVGGNNSFELVSYIYTAPQVT